MKRYSDWPVKLHEKLLALKDKPYEAGSHDCILAACTLIEAITGTDPASEFRGTYTTDLGALKQITKAGFGSLEEMVDSIAAKHGMASVPANFHHRGDLVMFADDVFGIVHLNGLQAVYVTTKGLATRPLSEVKRIWRVPFNG
jgi:hypothetical protein